MTALIGIIMGSTSDWDTMQHAAQTLEHLDIPHEVEVVSAHRTPDKLFQYAETAESKGLEVIIAGAGGAAHLPGMTAAKTVLPVLGVPVQSKALNGMDSYCHRANAGRYSCGPFSHRQAGAIMQPCWRRDVSNKHPQYARPDAYRQQQNDNVNANPDPRQVQ